MANHVMAQVRMPYTTNVDRDVSINTFHYFIPTGMELDEDTFTFMSTKLIEFYNTVAATTRVGQYLSKAIDRDTDACSIRYYLASPTLVSGKVVFGDPVTEVPFTMQAAQSSTFSLPLEVSACVSWVGYANSIADNTVLPRRRKGRDYIGPLNSAALDTTDDGVPDLNNTFRTNLVTAAKRLAGYNWQEVIGEPPAINDNPLLVVWSRGTQEGTVTPAPALTSLEASCTIITGGWVDDEFDTQRRRQMRTEVRETFDATVE